MGFLSDCENFGCSSKPVSPGDWPDYLSQRPLVTGPVRLHGAGEELLLEAGGEAEVEVVVDTVQLVAPHLRLR